MNRINIMKKYFKKKNGKVIRAPKEFINGDIDRALTRAKVLLVNDKLSNPFVLRGPNLDNPKLRFRLHHDKKQNIHEVDFDNSILSAIYLGEKRLHYYQADIDHINGVFYSEVTGDIKYTDIINVEVELNNDVTDSNIPINSEVNLVITLVNDDFLEFNLRNHYAFKDARYPDVLTEDELYIVKTIKEAVNLI